MLSVLSGELTYYCVQNVASFVPPFFGKKQSESLTLGRYFNVSVSCAFLPYSIIATLFSSISILERLI